MPSCETNLNTIGCGIGPVRTRCYHCGQVACPGCSRLRIWRGKRVRLCNDCVGGYQSDEDEGTPIELFGGRPGPVGR